VWRVCTPLNPRLADPKPVGIRQRVRQVYTLRFARRMVEVVEPRRRRKYVRMGSREYLRFRPAIDDL
jgi:hypothetical protein